MTLARVVYVVAKAPRPGVCKTRLCPPLTPDQAADLARAFLLDTLDVVGQAACVARVICASDEEQRLLQALVDPAIRVSAQTGQGLGDALEMAFREGVADGFPGVAVLGADSPTLPPAVVHEAFSVLDDDLAVALGPSRDGGYYLLAARGVHPPLFRDMPWSTSQVAAETVRRCRTAGLRSRLLPTWYDVDDVASLAELDAELRLLPAEVAAHTRLARHASGSSSSSSSSSAARLAPIGAGR